MPSTRKLRVACFGGRAFGSLIARNVAQACQEIEDFDDRVMLWTRRETYNGEPLADHINRTHESPKYMKGLHFPSNITATSDVKVAAAGADILVFVMRRSGFLPAMGEIKGVLKRGAIIVIMSKDYIELVDNQLQFASQLVSKALGCKTAVLMGGTLASDMAAGCFTEATLGCDDAVMSGHLLKLFNRPNFCVTCIPAVQSVELCAMLKTVVSLASGFCDALGTGTNTKSAIVRFGAVELLRFAMRFYPNEPFEEALGSACGWTDLIVSTFGNSRNRLCAAEFAKDESKCWEELSGQFFFDTADPPSGVRIIIMVATFLRSKNLSAEFPFICKVHNIVTRRDHTSTLTEMAYIPVQQQERDHKMRVALMGSGNWGTAIARIAGENVHKLPEFEQEIKMWVFEEMVDGKKLTEIINSTHENVKYLPGFKIPENVVAVPDPVEAARGADILVFNLPHQFLNGLLDKIQPVLKPGAIAISMIKGHIVVEANGASMKTGTQVIAERLGLSGCACLNGANVANDVAAGHFAEATLGCHDREQGRLLARLFNTPTFSVRRTSDVLGVELFGGIKNIVALAAGFCDGLNFAANTKAAVLRRGLLEMAQLVRELAPASKLETVLESCGIADLLTTCYSGRNRKCSEVFAREPSKSWEDIEREHLNGQKLQGPSCCYDIQEIINCRNLQDTYPLLTAIHAAATKEISPMQVFQANGFVHRLTGQAQKSKL